MAVPQRQSDPVRDHLVEVRRGLLRLHKALIDAERRVFERGRGPVSNTQLLQALLEDPFFAWLRPYSRLIAEIDEVLSTREPVAAPAARGFVEQARALVATPDEGDTAMSRYEQVRSHNAEVLLAHVEMHSRIDTALQHLGAA